MKKHSRPSEIELFGVVAISIYALRVIGLAPFTQQTRTSTENSVNTRWPATYYFSKTGLAYNLFLVILHQVLTALIFPKLMLSLNYENSSSVTQVFDLGLLSVCTFASYAIIISWAFRQKKAVSVMNRLLEVDCLLSGLEKKPQSGRNMLLSFSSHTIFNIVLWIFFSITEAVIVSDVFVACLFFGTPMFVVYWFIVEYFVVVRLVAREFGRVNKNLSKLEGIPKDFSRTMFLNDYLTVLTLSTHSQLDSLQLLRTIRRMLTQVSQDVVDFFSLPTLLSIGVLFLSFVYNVYFIISPLLSKSDEFPWIVMTTGTAWILVSIYPLIFLSFNVTKAAKEVREEYVLTITSIFEYSGLPCRVESGLDKGAQPRIISLTKNFVLCRLALLDE